MEHTDKLGSNTGHICRNTRSQGSLEMKYREYNILKIEL